MISESLYNTICDTIHEYPETEDCMVELDKALKLAGWQYIIDENGFCIKPDWAIMYLGELVPKKD